MSKLICHGEKNCTGSVTYIDEKGFIYCTIHGAIRRMYRRCRPLRLKEIDLLEAGKPLASYDGGAK